MRQKKWIFGLTTEILYPNKYHKKKTDFEKLLRGNGRPTPGVRTCAGRLVNSLVGREGKGPSGKVKSDGEGV